jgi:hypothetical protein
MSNGYTTSLDSVEHEDKLSFLNVVPGEQFLIVDHHATLFEKPATGYTR